MKTIIDVVNYFEAEWPAAGKTTVYDNALLNGYHFGGCITNDTICTASEFNSLVTELSNWQPTLPKAETVEHEGKLYKINDIYEFSLSGNCWSAGRLIAINSGDNFPFESDDDDSYALCREIDKACIGTITPAPTKLIDGEAYKFEYIAGKFIGIYCEKENEFHLSHGRLIKLNLCTNITRLVTEVK